MLLTLCKILEWFLQNLKWLFPRIYNKWIFHLLISQKIQFTAIDFRKIYCEKFS